MQCHGSQNHVYGMLCKGNVIMAAEAHVMQYALLGQSSDSSRKKSNQATIVLVSYWQLQTKKGSTDQIRLTVSIPATDAEGSHVTSTEHRKVILDLTPIGWSKGLFTKIAGKTNTLNYSPRIRASKESATLCKYCLANNVAPGQRSGVQ